MVSLASKNVKEMVKSYLFVIIPVDADAETIADLRFELEIYREHYYGNESLDYPIETTYEEGYGTIMRFPTWESMSGRDYNPLVFDDIVQIEDLKAERRKMGT